MMELILTIDNQRQQEAKRSNGTYCSKGAYKDLCHIAECLPKELLDKYKNNVWYFPSRGKADDDYNDEIKKLSVEKTKKGRRVITTGNIMGFVGYGNTLLTIRSRFSKNDWFMQYMLQKVFAIKVFELKHIEGEDNILDVALLLPYFLGKALGHGLYQEYIRGKYNDSRVRGTIDFNTHIRTNFPFKNGRVAYSVRERRYDNSVTQLIRHTIELLKGSKQYSRILYSSTKTKECVKRIMEATPSYRRGDRCKVIRDNVKPKIHPFYSEYRHLQELCMQILQYKKFSYNCDDPKGIPIHGILFDGAWLWEEYLNCIFSKKFSQEEFSHPLNKLQKGGIEIFNEGERKLYPDFIFKKNGTPSVIADAKYKEILKEVEPGKYNKSDIQRRDLQQMITYLHLTGVKRGVFVSPTDVDPSEIKINPSYISVDKDKRLIVYKEGDLRGDGGEIKTILISIPKECKNYDEFSAAMEKMEGHLIK